MKNLIRNIISRLPRWLATALTLATVLFLTLSPAPEQSPGIHLFKGADKVVHFLMFAFLCYISLFESNLSGLRRVSPATRAVAAAALASLIGLGIEFLQKAMNCGRSYDIFDFAADTAGAVSAAFLWFCLNRTQSNPARK